MVANLPTLRMTAVKSAATGDRAWTPGTGGTYGNQVAVEPMAHRRRDGPTRSRVCLTWVANCPINETCRTRLALNRILSLR